MKSIKVLELESLNDLFKLILDGEPIEIFSLGLPDSDKWWKELVDYSIFFYHWTDNFRIYYEGVVDKASKKFKSLKIRNLIEIEEEYR